ncbi:MULTISPECIES: YodC family protein [Dysgonomonas]|uniref:DUF2158 domain-containing protein n=1 Tax=Dysgonomonas gadei ATCC BAA-286 TaxID=742766 RepID=F5IXM6_9BACT|nr:MULTISPECIES: DUF2158 domain-containing protein [Dysgonomonas]EGK01695.1 hypothetical protein HMPREF9455_01843 [Dysgonomonas gadei ATCC BAA-286]MBF0648050.1 DUF2158 domain-containing protein [Dysgonomonas sp. GY75]
MAELKIGDIVCLKSGGPTMTIESIGEYMYETKAVCTWFDEKKKISDTFKLEALRFIED